MAISFSESCFFGGMCGSESGRIALASTLRFTLRGTNTGPFSPPFRAFSLVVSRKPPFFFSSLWHERQFARIIFIAAAGVRSAFAKVGSFSAAKPAEHAAKKTSRNRYITCLSHFDGFLSQMLQTQDTPRRTP